MKNKLLIIGASGHGKVVADVALKMNKWDDVFFLDDDENVTNSLGINIIGKSDDIYRYIDDYDIFVGIGNNATREKYQKRLEAMGASIPTLIHTSATIGLQVHLGAGTVILAGAIVNCCTKIGKGCILNTGCTIDHDNYLDDYVHVSPGVNLAGAVKVGRGTWIGVGSTICNNIEITNQCVIGAGAVVTRDITKIGTYVGVPAKKIK